VKDLKSENMKNMIEIQTALVEMRLHRAINEAVIKGGKEADKFMTVRESCIDENKFIDSIIPKLESFLKSENAEGVSDVDSKSGVLHDVSPAPITEKETQTSVESALASKPETENICAVCNGSKINPDKFGNEWPCQFCHTEEKI
jgi:hypothetical protein